MSGVKVGTVTAIDLDRKTYQAVVHLAVSSSVPIPADTNAKIVSELLLGGMVVVLDPGGRQDHDQGRRRDHPDAGRHFLHRTARQVHVQRHGVEVMNARVPKTPPAHRQCGGNRTASRFPASKRSRS